MRFFTDDCIELIKSFEGFYPNIYKCPAGVDTIGYGTVVRDKSKFIGGITEEQAEELMRLELIGNAKSIIRLVRVPLTDGQFDALGSFVYNLGSGSLQRSTMRQMINREEYIEAADELLKWCKASGRVLRGLLRRRIIERELFLS